MAIITVGAVILLILIGSLVRMTGAGMGCPDWPKCFGQWVPPTDVSELPADYQTRFAVAGKEIAPFDAFKTWTEYLNRLFGVLVGLFGLATQILAIRLWRKDKGLFWISLGGLFLILLAAGLGAYVVMTNLSEGAITIHMVVALGVLSMYLWGSTRASREQLRSTGWLSTPERGSMWLAAALLLLVLSQIVMGTQVREQIDAFLKQGLARSEWIEALTGAYNIHKFSHYAISLGMIWLVSRLWKRADQRVRKLMVGGYVLLGAEILFGLGMHHFEVPKPLQPLHLLFSALLFAMVFVLLRWIWIQRHVPQRIEVRA